MQWPQAVNAVLLILIRSLFSSSAYSLVPFWIRFLSLLTRTEILIIKMGILMSRMFERLFGSKEVRILILGLDNAGKTTILYRLQNESDEAVQTIPTIGFNVETLQYKNIKVGRSFLAVVTRLHRFICNVLYQKSVNFIGIQKDSPHFRCRLWPIVAFHVYRIVPSMGSGRTNKYPTVLAMLLSKYRRNRFCGR